MALDKGDTSVLQKSFLFSFIIDKEAETSSLFLLSFLSESADFSDSSSVIIDKSHFHEGYYRIALGCFYYSNT
jgi:hypothetical protein